MNVRTHAHDRPDRRCGLAILPCQAPGTRSLSRDIRCACVGWLLLVTLLAASPANADYPVAPDVVVFCEPTLQHVVADIGALWRARTGIKVRVFTSPTPALLQQIAHHARDDVIIGEGDAEADAAADQHLIKKETVERIWGNHLVAASLAGGSDRADSGSPAANKLAAVAGKNRLPSSIRGRQEPAPIVKRLCNRSASGKRSAPSPRASSVLRTRPICWRKVR